MRTLEDKTRTALRKAEQLKNRNLVARERRAIVEAVEDADFIDGHELTGQEVAQTLRHEYSHDRIGEYPISPESAERIELASIRAGLI